MLWEGVKDFEQLNIFLNNLTTIECLQQVIDDLKHVLQNRKGIVTINNHYTLKKILFYLFQTNNLLSPN